MCALTPGCLQQALDWSEKIREQGSWGDVSIEWTISNLRNATDTFPDVPHVTTLFSGSGTFTGKSAPREFAKRHGLDPHKVGDAVEALKDTWGIPPDADIEIEKDTGKVIDPRTGETIGNIFDELPYTE